MKEMYLVSLSKDELKEITGGGPVGRAIGKFLADATWALGQWLEEHCEIDYEEALNTNCD